ncbi:hypothetical protein D9756_007955 [Leucocoprinus leucothites]|uniref:Uncharacterized protein n=1 Tax=Leucocoprinus leucothites TaxID=201217 RepID=A0A8H5FYK2_9AGAR|nr:hypothetical protein D9756_007955 [Leucoagaricus leucothites]
MPWWDRRIVDDLANPFRLSLDTTYPYAMDGSTSKATRGCGVEPESNYDETNSGKDEGPLRSSSNPASSDDDSHSTLEYGDRQHNTSNISRRKQRTREILSKEVDHEHHHHFYDHSVQGPSKEVPQRAWYEFDFMVMIALISPVGNWLTGGDHVKNLLSVALLVFYLHQVIEVPWELYQKARRRNRPANLPPLTSEDEYRELAISELRKFELFCLALTIFSPFIGASLLRYATHSVLGPDSISWFSTGLFVMATGMRPWSHLIERLNQRTTDLQDYIHHPPPTSYRSSHEIQEDLDAVLDRVDKLERTLDGIKDRLLTSDDIFDHVDNALGSMRRSLRKRQKRWNGQEERFRLMEKSIASLSESTSDAGRRTELIAIPGITASAVQSLLKRAFSRRAYSSRSQSPAERSRHEPTQSSKLSPNGAISSPWPETIQGEGYDKVGSLLNKPLGMTVAFISGLWYVMLIPFRLAIRVLFGRQ